MSANFFGPIGQMASAAWTTAQVAGNTAVVVAGVVNKIAPHVNKTVEHTGNALVAGAEVLSLQSEKLDYSAQEWAAQSRADLLAWKAAKGIK